MDASLKKRSLRRMIRRATRRALLGRTLDRGQPQRGRFTREDLDRLLADTWRNFDLMLPHAHLEKLKTRGNRKIVTFGVVTLAIYKAMQAAGVEKGYATEFVADISWKVYERWVVLPRLLARLRTRDRQKQVDAMFRMFLRYTFNRPGYEWEILPQNDTFALNIYRCPLRDYFKSQDEEEFFRNTLCTLDFAFAQIMTEGGHYERPHSLSAGDKVCDMKWFGNRRLPPP